MPSRTGPAHGVSARPDVAVEPEARLAAPVAVESEGRLAAPLQLRPTRS
ncbi:hypothetical protein [Streptomyces sp. NPDC048111]